MCPSVRHLRTFPWFQHFPSPWICYLFFCFIWGFFVCFSFVFQRVTNVGGFAHVSFSKIVFHHWHPPGLSIVSFSYPSLFPSGQPTAESLFPCHHPTIPLELSHSFPSTMSVQTLFLSSLRLQDCPFPTVSLSLPPSSPSLSQCPRCLLHWASPSARSSSCSPTTTNPSVPVPWLVSSQQPLLCCQMLPTNIAQLCWDTRALQRFVLLHSRFGYGHGP